MTGRVADKVALVTGAGSGIGRACAVALAREGAVVYASDVDTAGTAETVAAITASGGRATALALDVSRQADWQAAIDRIDADHGRLDVLVNNAGIYLPKTMMETSLDDFRRVIAVNTDGAFLGMRAAVGLMRKAAGGKPATGSIINMSSISALKTFPGTFPYTVSKEALRILSKAVGVELGRRGDHIRVNAVLPGAVRTPMTEPLNADGGWDALMAAIPMAAQSEPEDIAQGVVWLASDESRFVTGTDLHIDGGWAAT